MSILLKTNIPIGLNAYLKRHLKNKSEDCVLYSKDGAEFKIHKELLVQTKFMREVLKSAKNHCCCKLEIICPCTKQELMKIVNFLYFGEVQCEDVFESFNVQEDLNKMFGFPECLNLDDQMTSLSNDPFLTSIIDLNDFDLNKETIDNMADELNIYVNPVDMNKNVMKSSGMNKHSTSNNIEKLKEKSQDPTIEINLEKNANIIQKDQETDFSNETNLENTGNVDTTSKTNDGKNNQYENDISSTKTLIESNRKTEKINEKIIIRDDLEVQAQNSGPKCERDIKVVTSVQRCSERLCSTNKSQDYTKYFINVRNRSKRKIATNKSPDYVKIKQREKTVCKAKALKTIKSPIILNMGKDRSFKIQQKINTNNNVRNIVIIPFKKKKIENDVQTVKNVKVPLKELNLDSSVESCIKVNENIQERRKRKHFTEDQVRNSFICSHCGAPFRNSSIFQLHSYYIQYVMPLLRKD